MIPHNEWRWFGNAGHFVGSWNCRFHLTTQVGAVLVSSVGDYAPLSRNVYESIGLNRLYETMVFRIAGLCECGCGLPELRDADSLETKGYNNRAEATAGHLAMCERWAQLDQQVRAAVSVSDAEVPLDV